MKFPDSLMAGTLVRRYKRFLSDIALDGGDVVTAHCANPGSMLSVDEAGAPVWVSPSRNPKRKLRYTWELIEIGGSLVGINTSLPNGLVEEAVVAGAIAEMLAADGPVFLDMAVARDENVFPMIPAGAAHNEMVLGPNQQMATVDDRNNVMA